MATIETFRRLFRFRRLAGLGLLAVLAATAAGYVLVGHRSAALAHPVPAAAARSYDGEKVVYHITEPMGLLHRNAKRWVANMENHFNAVPSGDLSLVVVMNGDGVDLLAAAKADADLAGRIDRLKAKGAKFLICRNTLVSRGIDPEVDLYGVGPDDIIPAGVAEIAHLQTKGYAYLRP